MYTIYIYIYIYNVKIDGFKNLSFRASSRWEFGGFPGTGRLALGFRSFEEGERGGGERISSSRAS